MKNLLMALATSAALASVAFAGAAQAATFTGDASFATPLSVTNPGLQLKANVLANSGPQAFNAAPLAFALNAVGDSVTLDLFVVRTREATLNADDLIAKGFALAFSLVGYGSAVVTGTTFAASANGTSFGVIDFGDIATILIGGGQAITFSLADATFNTGQGLNFTPGKPNGATIAVTATLAAVPVPATLPLGLSALALLGLLARRRKTAAVV